MSKERKELRVVLAGFIIVAGMLLGFSIRTYFRIYRLKPGDVVRGLESLRVEGADSTAMDN